MSRGMLRHIAIVGCMCLAPAAQAATSAQNANSIYAGVFGGVTLVPDIDVTSPAGTSKLESDVGFGFGGVAGYKWAIGLRAEAEISYRQNGSDKLDGVGVGGDASALGFMGNVWYDFDTGTPFIPYIGGGAGIARVSADIDIAGIKLVNDTDTVFAWQVGGGVGYEITKGVVLFGDYRYFATADPTFTAEPVLGGVDLDAEYSSHNFMIGVRGHF